MPDDPVERTVRQYIAHGASEGAMAAAQRISEAVGIGLDEVLAAVQKAGATLAGEGSLTIGATVTTPAGVVIVSADTAAATDGLGVVRRVDVDHLSAQASPSGLARLSANQWILLAVILIAAIFPVLTPDAQKAILDDATLAAAVTVVLGLLKR
ncbi:MAG: hypothetical protein ACLP52_07310 [Streptosporangiaceae bacterium]